MNIKDLVNYILICQRLLKDSDYEDERIYLHQGISAAYSDLEQAFITDWGISIPDSVKAIITGKSTYNSSNVVNLYYN